MRLTVVQLERRRMDTRVHFSIVAYASHLHLNARGNNLMDQHPIQGVVEILVVRKISGNLCKMSLSHMFKRNLMSNTILTFPRMCESNGNITVVEFVMLIAFFLIIVILYAPPVKPYSSALKLFWNSIIPCSSHTWKWYGKCFGKQAAQLLLRKNPWCLLSSPLMFNYDRYAVFNNLSFAQFAS